MSASGGVSIARTRRGENRFYNPPPMRKLQQMRRQQEEQRAAIQKASVEKRTDPEDCATLPSPSPSPSLSLSASNTSVNKKGDINTRSSNNNLSNLDRFLEYTTPVVQAQCLPKTSMRSWQCQERAADSHPYFVLGDLWESFKEWSAYGAGVPLLLNGSETVMQYYVPYLSGIQLYIDPSRRLPRLRRAGEESDTDSSRDTSSDGSGDYGAGRRAVVPAVWNQQSVADGNIQRLSRLSLRNQNLAGSSSDESDICNTPAQLIFEYLEHDQPFSREPLADRISSLASQFPELKTYRSCDLSPSSWISVAWYPIYRIPMGPTLQNLDACFLTYHSLSTMSQSTGPDGLPFHGFTVRDFHSADMSSKLPLPTFGLASYKFKVSVWNPDGVSESQKANSLFRAADNWLRLLKVNHPDYMFFVSHNTYWR